MCRSIKRLREGKEVAGQEEIRAATLQFVRKVTGFQKPSAKHEPAFGAAVDEISRSVEHLLAAVAAGLS
jgi:hypothetical protein